VLAAAGLSGLRGHAVDVSCARRASVAAPGNVDGLYVLVALDDEPPRLLFRSSVGGTWTQQQGAFFPTARKVAVGTFVSVSQGTSGTARNEVQMAAVTDDGHLLTASAPATATQPVQQPDEVEATAGETGEIRGVALDSVFAIDSPTSVPLLIVTADARLLQTRGRGATIDDANGQWVPWIEVLAGPVARAVPADALDADLAARSVVAATGDGHAWLAPALPTLALGAWVDLETYTATFSGGPWSGTFTTTFDVGTFSTVAAAWASEGLHVVGTTTDGRLWHQLRSPTAIFRDIELAGVGADVGAFTAVDCG
jgi:hypothetical protein